MSVADLDAGRIGAWTEGGIKRHGKRDEAHEHVDDGDLAIGDLAEQPDPVKAEDSPYPEKRQSQ